MIRLNGASASIHDRTVFSDVSFEILPGKGTVIRGNNGSGKTLLLEVLAGRRRVSRGTVEFDFIDLNATWEEQFDAKRRYLHYVPALALHDFVGNVPQLYYQQRYYQMGGEQFQNVAAFLGTDQDNLQRANLPSSLNLTSLLDIEVNRLSNGQIRKLIILKELLRQIPKVLLLDYPFEGLDRGSRKELAEFLDELVSRFGVALVMTDHHHELPASVSTTVNLGTHQVSRSTEVKSSDKSQGKELVAKPVVEMRDVTVRYDKKTIINKFNWTVRQGERWALTGPNGSGKTTIFSLIYADHPLAYSQDVSIFGRRRGTGESIWDIKARVNYLGPEQSHYMTDGRFLVIDYLKEHGSSEEVLMPLIEYFGIATLLNRRIRELSHGELQIVQLIRFFASKKELLLLDEPFQFLDLSMKDKVVQYLNSYLDKQSTLILITHYEDDLERWTNHVKEMTTK